MSGFSMRDSQTFENDVWHTAQLPCCRCDEVVLTGLVQCIAKDSKT